MSQSANIHYTTTLAAAYPETLLTISVNPGMSDTEIIPNLQAVGRLDSITTTHRSLVVPLCGWWRSWRDVIFLNRRVLTVEWDAENLVERKEEITSKNLGAEQIMD